MEKDKPVLWEIMSTGIEETVPLDLLSPNAGAHLISGVGDDGGFIHVEEVLYMTILNNKL